MKRKINNKTRRVLMLVAALAVLILFLWWQTYGLVVTSYTYSNTKISAQLDGLRVVQISDLHNKNFGKKLIKAVAEQHPDIIVITGDMISRHSKHMDYALAFLEQASQLAPIYYIPGNHEAGTALYDQLKAALVTQGVILLEDDAVIVEHNNAKLQLLGIIDPAFYGQGAPAGAQAVQRVQSTVSRLVRPELLNILLAHRPILLETYAQAGADLVFCGHAHGGQIRLPFVGALVAPDEGFFPKYTGGVYQRHSTSMVVSRGLGDSRWMPLRLFDRPQVVVVTLQTATK